MQAPVLGPAPIQRDTDCRLYGTSLVAPYSSSCAWARKVTQVPAKERALALIALAVVTVVISAVPALVGRTIQVLHYRFLSKQEREHPAEVFINGTHFHLPKDLKPCELPQGNFYFTAEGDEKRDWDSAFQLGTDFLRLKEVPLILIANQPEDPINRTHLKLSLDLREREVAYLDKEELMAFLGSDKTANLAKLELFRMNGYRAIKLGEDRWNKESAWIVCDESCITIQSLFTPKK